MKKRDFFKIKTHKNQQIEDESTLISLYSKSGIIILSIIFTPLLGGLMLYYNLQKTKRDNVKNIASLLSYVIFSFLFITLFNMVYVSYLRDIVPSGLGYINNSRYELIYKLITLKIVFKAFVNFIFIYHLWKVYFGDGFLYQPKNIPMVIRLIIYGILILKADFSFLQIKAPLLRSFWEYVDKLIF